MGSSVSLIENENENETDATSWIPQALENDRVDPQRQSVSASTRPDDEPAASSNAELSGDRRNHEGPLEERFFSPQSTPEHRGLSPEDLTDVSLPSEVDVGDMVRGDSTVNLPNLTDQAQPWHLSMHHQDSSVEDPFQVEDPSLLPEAEVYSVGHAVLSEANGDVLLVEAESSLDVSRERNRGSVASSTSLRELAAMATRAVCPSDLTEIMCPSDVVDAVLGTDGDVVMPPHSTALARTQAPQRPEQPLEITRSDSWLSTFFYGTPEQIRRTPPSVDDFLPTPSENFEWMGRDLDTLLRGHATVAPVLARSESVRGRIDPATSAGRIAHGGTLAHMSNVVQKQEQSQDRETHLETRGHMQSSRSAGPNIALSLLARETTGLPGSTRSLPVSDRLRQLGGETLFGALDHPAGGIILEMNLLDEALDRGDWTETHSVVSQLALRLVGDSLRGTPEGSRNTAIDDPTLPPSASPFHAGGGRLGLERDTFVLTEGVQLLLRVFRESAFVGSKVGETNDARDINKEVVNSKLSMCWNEVLATFRELIYALPNVVEDGFMMEDGNFIPFLFTMLAHESMFDGAAVLIEEILSVQSLSQTTGRVEKSEENDLPFLTRTTGRSPAPPTFFLGNVPDLYGLWGSFTCRQLAHFCRILALLVFEPEDRQVYDNPGVLKSIDLLQLRRDRGARDGRDATVNMNQAILIGDHSIVEKFLLLLRVMNYAPSMQRSSAFRTIAHYPFVADTLGMVGLNDISDWDEVGRLETLARSLLPAGNTSSDVRMGDLGRVADMLEGLASRLPMGDPMDPAAQLGNIINVINAAQQAGIVIGRRADADAESDNSPVQMGSASLGSRQPSRNEVDGVPSMGWVLSDQVIVRRLNSGESTDRDEAEAIQIVGIGIDRSTDGQAAVHHLHTGITPRTRSRSPQDAANELQFNAFVLAPFQVEVFFILCTLLGARRKFDTQKLLRKCGLVEILNDAFYRLSWGRTAIGNSRPDGDSVGSHGEPHGIHGPGCDCTPESSLCTQYLRLIHNFCDRDCDNYPARRLMLSSTERRALFEDDEPLQQHEIAPGLLTKLLRKLMSESDDSPYRFWLASCIESYLRGSSPKEQMFVANTGLLNHLVDDVTSDRLHCAGNLQTSFDLLGELCKGNEKVLRLLIAGFTERKFRKLMDKAASNLIDSNVFLRSLMLTVEHLNESRYSSFTSVRSYLTHSWWDTPTSSQSNIDEITEASHLVEAEEMRAQDWFSPPRFAAGNSLFSSQNSPGHNETGAVIRPAGWVFSPASVTELDTSWPGSCAPNTLERLSWFLYTNRARLLRDLLGVVDLRNINHENICCLNTAIVVNLLAERRNELPQLLDQLRMLEYEQKLETMQRQKSVLDVSVLERRPDLDDETTDPLDVLTNFRQLLWFWTEYYSHRGRDRLSLEFYSRLRFDEWHNVVAKLSADDGSRTSLVTKPVRLARSPYRRSAQLDGTPSRAR